MGISEVNEEKEKRNIRTNKVANTAETSEGTTPNVYEKEGRQWQEFKGKQSLLTQGSTEEQRGDLTYSDQEDADDGCEYGYDVIVTSAASDGALELKGLPVPQGKHTRFIPSKKQKRITRTKTTERTEISQGRARYEGDLTYSDQKDADDDCENGYDIVVTSAATDGALELKGLPVPQGQHTRFIPRCRPVPSSEVLTPGRSS
ncbi:hypothetical protein E2562_001386 [Oryza meyeriana var. granulata]|uniref:Uncharacterized protein n=1 Tax=Oryza meyeriana var. granulata TaxID=110450 RepID=A0A6G1DEM6_9ORYZ|nr:hypothetical protein E2562_001386 [Oryza meyeriana var. granulata]